MPSDCSINLQLAGRLCVVVGAGQVGIRKAKQFLAAGATVRLVGPQDEPVPQNDRLEVIHRKYQSDDLNGALLVVAATDQPHINQQIAQEARSRGLLVNLANDGAESDFSFPAVRQQGPLRLAISTTGVSPAMAGILADHFLEVLEPGWELALELAGRLRAWQLTHPEHTAYNRSILRHMIDQGLIEQLSAGQFERVDQLLHDTCGAGCSLATLGLNLPRDYDR